MSPVAVPVYGLILAGGLSSRMHRDKGALLYRGKTQGIRSLELIYEGAAGKATLTLQP